MSTLTALQPQTLLPLSSGSLPKGMQRSNSQTASQHVLQPANRIISQNPLHTNSVIIRSRDSTELRKVGDWYQGQLRDLPPQEDALLKWSGNSSAAGGVAMQLAECLSRIVEKMSVKLPRNETATEPFLCMAGKECNATEASKFLPGGAKCPPHPVLLKTTVWISCGGSKCKRKVKKEVLPTEAPLRDFLQLFHPPIQLRISKMGPRTSGNMISHASSEVSPQSDGMSFAVQYPALSDKGWPATARFTIGPTELYSMIGGAIEVNGSVLGLTTAHGIFEYLDQTKSNERTPSSDEEDLSSDGEDSSSDEDEEEESSEEDEQSSRIISTPLPVSSSKKAITKSEERNTEVSSELHWESVDLPKTLAYLGRGTLCGDYSFQESAPLTSDFALVNLHSHRGRLPPLTPRVSSKASIFPGEVAINYSTNNLPLTGYLLPEDSVIIMRGSTIPGKPTRVVTIQTRKIQLDRPARKYSNLYYDHPIVLTYFFSCWDIRIMGRPRRNLMWDRLCRVQGKPVSPHAVC
jgi:hypothetical protein